MYQTVPTNHHNKMAVSDIYFHQGAVIYIFVNFVMCVSAGSVQHWMRHFRDANMDTFDQEPPAQNATSTKLMHSLYMTDK
jgi:hypothetical protein